MNFTTTLILFSACVIFCSGASISAFFTEHLKRVYLFTCGKSQPRLVHYHELESDDFIGVNKVFPAVTVLHRCECTGFCSMVNKECGAKRIENVDLVFKIDGVMKSITVKNHTECACVDKQNKPK